MARPYTYMLVCDQTNEMYIGSRSANKLQAVDDITYLSSSTTVKNMIKNGFSFKKIILAEWPSAEDAISHEIFLHSYFDVGKNPAFLNKSKQTSTGFTGCGLKGKPNKKKGIPNPEHSLRLKGRPNPAVSNALLGRRRPDISAALLGKTNPKVSLALKGKKLSIETREAMSQAKKGKPPNNKGKSLSEQTRKKMSDSRIGKDSPTKGISYEKRQCPYCSVIGGGPAMTAQHFEKCKYKPETSLR